MKVPDAAKRKKNNETESIIYKINCSNREKMNSAEEEERKLIALLRSFWNTTT